MACLREIEDNLFSLSMDVTGNPGFQSWPQTPVPAEPYCFFSLTKVVSRKSAAVFLNEKTLSTVVQRTAYIEISPDKHHILKWSSSHPTLYGP